MRSSPLASLLYLLLFGCLPLAGLGQQGNNWYFGVKAGLSFNTSPPTVLTDGAMSTEEGCSGISDNAGQLLFYTDGVKVYNKLHQVMPNGNGLLGHSSASNSAIVVPQPGHPDIYFIFTSAAVENYTTNGSYHYSVVDMSLNGGLGDVTVKNTLLHTNGTEKLAAAPHANGTDTWVITIAGGTNEFRLYKVDCSGVNPVPVVSNAGMVTQKPPISYGDVVGCLKVSPDSKKIATVRILWQGWEIFDFDNATGIVSNDLFISLRLERVFGVEFSPNSKLVYIATECCGAAGSVHQYKIDTYDAAAITASMYRADSSLYPKGGMQLAPDGKIYGTNEGDSSLYTINNPDVYGNGCNLVRRAVNLGATRLAMRALPSYNANVINNQYVDFNALTDADCKTVHFTAASTYGAPVSYTWDFGDGTSDTGPSVTHVFPATANNYPVILTVNYTGACAAKSTRFKMISLNRSIPKAGFTYNNQCGNLSVSFTDTSKIDAGGIINSWLWDFGDGTTSTQPSPAHTYTSVGNYTVTLTATNISGCGGANITSKTISLEAKPSAAFTKTKTCLNTPIQFSDISTISAGAVTGWYWNFGDAATTTTQHPLKTYTTTGDYIVKLVAKSATGCISDTITQVIQVSTIPKATFLLSDTCFGKNTAFNGSAAITNGNINNWWWDFGDNNFSSVQNSSHNYAATGSYTVRFAVTANTGCTDTVLRTTIIGAKPQALFTAQPECGNKQVTFTDQSSSPQQAVTKWYWDFGDNNNITTQHPTHSYNVYNAYTVKLVAITSMGCASDTAQKIIEVNAKPVALFEFANGCVNAPVQYINKSSIEAGAINSYTWQLGDGNTVAAASPAHAYTNYGNYTIKLVAVSDKNCVSDTAVKSISIEPKPVASFTALDGCAGVNLVLQNNTAIAFGTVSNYYWDFGNGNTATTALPGYSYPVYGNFNIKYTAISKNGCVADTVMQTVLIESNPVVDFAFGNTCVGKQINFINLSGNAFGNILSWNWSFGNGSVSADVEPAYTYSSFGNYRISLEAVTKNGCKATLSKTINITRVVINAGNDTTVAIGQPIQLLATGALNYNWSPVTYLNNPTSPKPVAIPSADIAYFVTGTTAEGCVGYDTLNIKVYKGPAVYVPNAFTPGKARNNLLRPVIPGVAKLAYFAVYNRWGQMVFHTTESGKGWNGKLNGADQPEGGYSWIIKFTDYTGKLWQSRGASILIR